MTRIMLPRTGTLIGETWLDSPSGGTIEHVNPATGQIQGVVPLAGPTEVDEAVRSAGDAHRSWRRMTPADRRDIILRWTELVRQHLDEHLHLTALESGRPISQGSAAVDWMAYYAGWADKIDGELIAPGVAGGVNYAVPDPYGVVAVILPFNGPVEIATMTAMPALVAGNCVVMKPPDVTPYTSALFANLALEAGMPPGVLNVVVGGRQTGESLVAHPGVNKISFTGSPPTARSIMTAASRNLTPLALELGGKSANIVFADADLAAAAAFSAMMALVPCSGQACVLPTRILVEGAVQDEFMDLVLTTVRSYKVGMPLEPDTVMGPVISEQAMYAFSASCRTRNRLRRAVSSAAVSGSAGTWSRAGLLSPPSSGMWTIPARWPKKRYSVLSCPSPRSHRRTRRSGWRTTPSTALGLTCRHRMSAELTASLVSFRRATCR